MYRYGYLREEERYTKRKFVFVCMIFTLAVASLWAGNMTGKAKTPFFRLNPYEISGISVQLTPPGENVELTDEEIQTVVEILGRVAVYERDSSYSGYSGQNVVFQIEKKDKSTVEIAAFAPFLVINGEGYRADYGACEDLSVLGNRILGSRRNEDGG
mgnify:CR=1 FL=1